MNNIYKKNFYTSRVVYIVYSNEKNRIWAISYSIIDATPIRLRVIISNFLVLCFISFSSGYFGLLHSYYIKNTNIRGKNRDFNEPSYTWVKYPDDFLGLLTYLIIGFLLQVTRGILLKVDGDELL
jgi:hypothetical protein